MNAAANHDDGAAILAERQERFVKAILDRMGADESILVDAEYSHIKDMHAKDLHTVVQVFVEGGAVPLRNEITDSMYSEILAFFADLTNDSSIACDEIGEGRVVHLTVGKQAIEPTGYSRAQDDYNRFTLTCAVEKLERLEYLGIENLRELSADLSLLKRLDRLYIQYDSPDSDQPQREPFQTAVLCDLCSIVIYFKTALDPKIVTWLRETRFPQLESLSICAAGDSRTDVATQDTWAGRILDAFAENESHQIESVKIGHGLSLEYLVDALLRMFPQSFPLVTRIDVWHFKTPPAEFFRTFWQQIANRHYHPKILSTLCVNLTQLTIPWNKHHDWVVEKKAVVNLLLFFKRLGSIPPAYYDKELHRHPRLDQRINYLLHINAGGGRVLVQDMATNTGDVPPSVANERNESQVQQRLPISAWPKVLERAGSALGRSSMTLWHHECKQEPNSTAIYRMLRPNSNLLGPALEGVLGEI